MYSSALQLFAMIFASEIIFLDALDVELTKISKYLNKDPVDIMIDSSDDYISKSLREALVNATVSDAPWLNQYSLPIGLERLRKAIAALYSKRFKFDINPEENVLVTVGAHEALNSAFQAFTALGDEWIIIEPFWPKFPAMVKLAKGIPRFTTLKRINKVGILYGNDYELDQEELESAITSRTKGILFNNPNNPSGKVYGEEDLQFITFLAKKYNLIIISDEVHEYVVYDPHRHVNLASIPGMFDYTITVGSASKSFSAAGWRLGWAIGPNHLIDNLKNVHNNLVYSAPTLQQDVLAFAIEKELQDYEEPHSFFNENRKVSEGNRNFLVDVLQNCGMLPVIPNAGYCMIVDLPAFRLLNSNKDESQQISMETFLRESVGVLGIPMGRFYGEEQRHLGEDSVRFCFHKSNATLQQVKDRLKKYVYNLHLHTVEAMTEV